MKIKQYYGINALVLYPPVDINLFSSISSYDKRENIIVTIPRFTPMKRLEEILYLAKRLPNYLFIMIESINKKNAKYLHELLMKKEHLHLLNVHILVNITRYQLLKILKIAKYYQHPPFE